jgi:hypothetical protein
MTGHFGNRVIGHQKAEEESILEETRAVHFGHRVIGDVLAKRRLEAREDDGAKDARSDPATKIAKRAKAAEEAAEKRATVTAEEDIETIEAPVTTNLQELAEALEGNAAFYEGLYASEFARPSGPRKSALRLFLVFEMEHEDREDRKADIEAALNPEG